MHGHRSRKNGVGQWFNMEVPVYGILTACAVGGYHTDAVIARVIIDLRRRILYAGNISIREIPVPAYDRSIWLYENARVVN